jgi:diguanylate cyclase (GGDEF)-like protein
MCPGQRADAGPSTAQSSMTGQLPLTAHPAWTRTTRVPVVRTVLALVVFLGALLSVVVFTLNRNANNATRQQVATQLASAARVAASVLAVDRADLRARAGQIVGSVELQRAVVTGDAAALARIARTRHARLDVGQRRFGALPGPPRLTSTASIEQNGEVRARVTLGLALGDATLAGARKATPLPQDASLLLVRDGRVIAGPFRGMRVVVRAGGLGLGSTQFAAGTAQIPNAGISVVAAEPLSKVTTSNSAYGRRTVIAAILTLLIAIGLAIRFARPVARTFGELSEQAEHDALTGLANRRLLDARLEEELERARRHGTHLGLVLIDVDDFKHFNDHYGHQCGDEILRTFGALLAGSVRELDLAGRFGGEEFALVLPGTPVEGACVLAEQIRKSLRSIEVAGPAGEPLRITASFGAAAFPSCASVEELIALADHSVYEAKRLGKDQVVGAGREPSLPEAKQRSRETRPRQERASAR